MLIRKSTHVARKTYTCDASEWLHNGDLRGFIYDCKPTYAELRAIAKAKRNCWRIVLGQEYIKEVGRYQGDFYTWRAIPEIDAICRKYNLYEYD